MALCPLLIAPAAEQSPLLMLTGKVQPLKTVLEKYGSKLDPDAAGTWFVLVTDDGKMYPLIKDDGGRMFSKDPRLLNRPMRLTGRLIADTHLLQVANVHSILKGELREVYYWCDICRIKRFDNRDCECCGAPMELRETPIKN